MEAEFKTFDSKCILEIGGTKRRLRKGDWVSGGNAGGGMFHGFITKIEAKPWGQWNVTLQTWVKPEEITYLSFRKPDDTEVNIYRAGE